MLLAAIVKMEPILACHKQFSFPKQMSLLKHFTKNKLNSKKWNVASRHIVKLAQTPLQKIELAYAIENETILQANCFNRELIKEHFIEKSKPQIKEALELMDISKQSMVKLTQMQKVQVAYVLGLIRYRKRLTESQQKEVNLDQVNVRKLNFFSLTKYSIGMSRIGLMTSDLLKEIEPLLLKNMKKTYCPKLLSELIQFVNKPNNPYTKISYEQFKPKVSDSDPSSPDQIAVSTKLWYAVTDQALQQLLLSNNHDHSVDIDAELPSQNQKIFGSQQFSEEAKLQLFGGIIDRHGIGLPVSKNHITQTCYFIQQKLLELKAGTPQQIADSRWFDLFLKIQTNKFGRLQFQVDLLNQLPDLNLNLANVHDSAIAQMIKVLREGHHNRIVLLMTGQETTIKTKWSLFGTNQMGKRQYTKQVFEVIEWLLKHLKQARLRLETLDMLSQSAYFSHAVDLRSFEDSLIEALEASNDLQELQKLQGLIDTHWWSASYQLREVTKTRLMQIQQNQ